MSLKDLRIGTRIGISVALSTVLMAAAIGTGIDSMRRVKAHLDVATEQRMPMIVLAKDIRDNLRLRSVRVRNIVILTDEAEMQVEAKRLAETHTSYQKLIGELRQKVSSEGEKAAVAELEKAVEALAEPTQKVLALGFANDGPGAIAQLTKSVRPLQAKATEAAEKLTEMQVAAAREASEEASQSFRTALVLAAGTGGLAIVLTGVLGWALVRSITRPLNRAVGLANSVAAGDLSQQIETGGKDETGQLLAALATMQESLRRLVTGVRVNAESVASASNEIAQGNSDLSTRTEQQASSLQQTAASMEELAGTVRSNADSAKQGTELAQGASQVASDGRQVVQEVNQTMLRISESSKRISEIIGVIDSIAFQTNILALNAAVEAARAGEQGRGFAVVAAEVRALAQRSATAAKEIKGLISDSAQRVDEGTALAGRAGATMQGVVDSIGRVAAIMAEISNATREQASGISQVGDAVTHMDSATQQNAALVEQAAAAADSLQRQAHQLVDAVAAFRLQGA